MVEIKKARPCIIHPPPSRIGKMIASTNILMIASAITFPDVIAGAITNVIASAIKRGYFIRKLKPVKERLHQQAWQIKSSQKIKNIGNLWTRDWKQYFTFIIATLLEVRQGNTHTPHVHLNTGGKRRRLSNNSMRTQTITTRDCESVKEDTQRHHPTLVDSRVKVCSRVLRT